MGEADKIRSELSCKKWKKDNYRQAMIVAAGGVMLMAQLLGISEGYIAKKSIDCGQWFEEFSDLWIFNNKLSELNEIEKVLNECRELLNKKTEG